MSAKSGPSCYESAFCVQQELNFYVIRFKLAYGRDYCNEISANKTRLHNAGFFYRFAFGKDSIQLSKVLCIIIQSLLMGVVWMVYTLPHSRVWGALGSLEAFWHQGREDIIFRDHAGFEHEYSASQTDT